MLGQGQDILQNYCEHRLSSSRGTVVPPGQDQVPSAPASLRDEIRPSFSQFHHLLDDMIRDSDPLACQSHDPAAQPFLTDESICWEAN